MVLKFLPIGLLSLSVALLLQERRSQPVSRRERKWLWFVVPEGVFAVDRLLERGDGGVQVATFTMQGAFEDPGSDRPQRNPRPLPVGGRSPA